MNATLYSKDIGAVAGFYLAVMSMEQEFVGQHHIVLRRGAFVLTIHALPDAIAGEIEISIPPEPREDVPLRLDYTIECLDSCVRLAQENGGSIDEQAKWAHEGTAFHVGTDPEGNVFGVLFVEGY